MQKANFPKILRNCPISDNSFEIRFNSDIEDAIFGIVFNKLRDEYKNINKLPITQLPPEIISTDLNLMYKPHYRLSNKTNVIQIGPKVISISSHPVYQGWSTYSKKISSFLESVKKMDIISDVTRIVLRYVNLFPDNIFKDVINIEIIHDQNVNFDNLLFRTESNENDYTKIIHLSSKAKSKDGKIEKTGSLIDIDIAKNNNLDDFLNNFKKELEAIHNIEKNEFFSLIKDDYLGKLDPEY